MTRFWQAAVLVMAGCGSVAPELETVCVHRTFTDKDTAVYTTTVRAGPGIAQSAHVDVVGIDADGPSAQQSAPIAAGESASVQWTRDVPPQTRVDVVLFVDGEPTDSLSVELPWPEMHGETVERCSNRR